MKHFVLSATLLLSTSVLAKEAYRGCPAKQDTHGLSSISFYDGDPSGDAQLAPDNTDEGNARTLHYVFDQKNAETQGVYQVCEYRASTKKIVTKLPVDIRRCEVTLIGKGAQAHASRVACHK